MTIQVTVANAYAVAMASDRHVYRGGHTLSTGRQSKLFRLRGHVPAAMMSAGSFSLLGFPLSRFTLAIEAALAATRDAGPDGLAEAALGALQQRVKVPGGSPDMAQRDTEILAQAADLVLGHARAYGDWGAGLEKLLQEIRRAPRCDGGEEVEALGRAVWQERAVSLATLARCPNVAEALSSVPDLLGEAAISALVRDWGQLPDASIMIGLCCPGTGVPAVVSVNVRRGLGDRLLFAPRYDRTYYVLHRAGRSLLLSQGSGGARVAAMIEGIASEYLASHPARDETAGLVDQRWQRTHERIAVSSPDELAGIAAGLVSAAEVIGYLTGEDEGSVAGTEAVLVTPQGLFPQSRERGLHRKGCYSEPGELGL
ncbi:MAG: hypothetical protein JOY71_03395 [Acetobacteraceae bacterium]|nr:hypothetical protein [Acetobacteraceae bacterium]